MLMCISFLMASDYPKWITSGLKVVAYFEENKYNEGYGLLIDEGLGLVSSSVVYANKKPLDIVLYNNEILGNPVACLSHARIIALDDGIGLALLKLNSFTDIYCNVLPQPNFRESHYRELAYSILKKPILWNPKDKISYFEEKDWLNFGEKRVDLETISDGNNEKILGMPLFVKDEFIGVITKTKISQNQHKIDIVRHKQILNFMCDLNKRTSVLLHYKNIKSFCSNR